MKHIYVLRDTRNGQVRYVGRTGNPTVRLSLHCSAPGPATAAWIGELRAAQLKPEMEIICSCADDIADFIEQRMIREYTRKYPGSMLNRTLNGLQVYSEFDVKRPGWDYPYASTRRTERRIEWMGLIRKAFADQVEQ